MWLGRVISEDGDTELTSGNPVSISRVHEDVTRPDWRRQGRRGGVFCPLLNCSGGKTLAPGRLREEERGERWLFPGSRKARSLWEPTESNLPNHVPPHRYLISARWGLTAESLARTGSQGHTVTPARGGLSSEVRGAAPGVLDQRGLGSGLA